MSSLCTINYWQVKDTCIFKRRSCRDIRCLCVFIHRSRLYNALTKHNIKHLIWLLLWSEEKYKKYNFFCIFIYDHQSLHQIQNTLAQQRFHNIPFDTSHQMHTSISICLQTKKRSKMVFDLQSNFSHFCNSVFILLFKFQLKFTSEVTLYFSDVNADYTLYCRYR